MLKVKILGNKHIRLLHNRDVDENIHLLHKLIKVIIYVLCSRALKLLLYLFDILPSNNCVLVSIDCVTIIGHEILELKNIPKLNPLLIKIKCRTIETLHEASAIGAHYKQISNKKGYDGPKYCPSNFALENNISIDYVLEYIHKTDNIDTWWSNINHIIPEFVEMCNILEVSCIYLYNDSVHIIDTTDILLIPGLKWLYIIGNDRPAILFPEMFKADIIIGKYYDSYKSEIENAHQKYDEYMRFMRTKPIMT